MLKWRHFIANHHFARHAEIVDQFSVIDMKCFIVVKHNFQKKYILHLFPHYLYIQVIENINFEVHNYKQRNNMTH